MFPSALGANFQYFCNTYFLGHITFNYTVCMENYAKLKIVI